MSVCVRVCAGSLWNRPGGQGIPERDYPEELHLSLPGVRADGGRVLRRGRRRVEASESVLHLDHTVFVPGDRREGEVCLCFYFE